MTILEQILATKREEVESRKKQISAGQLLETAHAGRKPLVDAACAGKFSLWNYCRV